MATKSSTTSQSVTLVAVLVILVAFGACYLFIIPQLTTAKKDLATAQAKSAGLTQDQQALQTAGQQLTAAEQSLTAKGVNFDAISSIYPTNEEMPNLYIQMDNLMAAAQSTQNVAATYTVANPVLNADQTAKVPVSFTATGAYTNLLGFFTLLETNLRPIIISQISFSPATTSTTTAKGTAPAPSDQLTASVTGYTLAASLSSAYSGSTAAQ